MNATIAEGLIYQKKIAERQTEENRYIFDQIVEVDSADDRMVFIIIDGLMTLLVYLAPVAVFSYLVAPVVARLLRMPIPS
jgi:hypothetical protein